MLAVVPGCCFWSETKDTLPYDAVGASRPNSAAHRGRNYD